MNEENTENNENNEGTDKLDFEDLSEQDGEQNADLSDEDESQQRQASDLEAVFDIPVSIQAVLGRTNMEVSKLLHLDEGDVVELDRKVGEAIDIYVNNRLVARGEVVLVDDRLGVTMTEIIKPNQTH